MTIANAHGTLLIVLLAAACTRAPDTTAKPVPPDVARLSMDSSWTGRVVVTGTAELPEVMLQQESGSAHRLVGDVAAELHALGGADVRVIASLASDVPGDALRVSSYEILAIDGERPFVGMLSADGGSLAAADGTLRLIGLPAAIAAAGGARVWATGERTGNELRVRSAGIIRR
jgi:hypothetical protein